MKPISSRILPAIVFSQFAGTSLWFAGNAVIEQIQTDWSLPSSSLAHITSAVMLGFILGTFLFAFFSIADRYKATTVFFTCSLLGALANSSILILPAEYQNLLISRFLTGFFLAGIYPVGMKIASDWFAENLGKALGFLVGALVLGTAFPHLLRYLGSDFNWTHVLKGTSILASVGGIIMYLFVGEGPYQAKGGGFNPSQLLSIFKNKEFRSAAIGYFGHMWELYAFWAFTPVAIGYYNQLNGTHLNTSLYSFLIIGIGAVGCVLAGVLSIKKGSAKVAFSFLFISGIACLLSPILYTNSSAVFIAAFLIWGLAVVADSAQFSTLNAQTCPKELKGTALTIVVCIGFLITIPSIQFIGYLNQILGTKWILTALCIGPLIGLLSVRKLIPRRQ